MRFLRTSARSKSDRLVAASTTGLLNTLSGAFIVDTMFASASFDWDRKRLSASRHSKLSAGTVSVACARVLTIDDTCSRIERPLPEPCRRTSPNVHGSDGVSSRYRTRPTNRLRALSFQYFSFASTFDGYSCSPIDITSPTRRYTGRRAM